MPVATFFQKIGKSIAVGIIRKSGKFLGHPYMGRIARPSLRYHSFLVMVLHSHLHFTLKLVPGFYIEAKTRLELETRLL